MHNISTQLLSYSEIDTCTTDLVEDAFGIDHALKAMLPCLDLQPEEFVIAGLLEKIHHGTKVH
ncbi:MAG: hypothetical protein MUC78_09635 [Bacteroidales bacterium]|nr:hypothetical protein [Bacteroidales bacterium]